MTGCGITSMSMTERTPRSSPVDRYRRLKDPLRKLGPRCGQAPAWYIGQAQVHTILALAPRDRIGLRQ
jgi:hypothetical protein